MKLNALLFWTVFIVWCFILYGAANGTSKTTPITDNKSYHETPISPSVHQLISTAEKHLGTPYQFGGKSPKGFDCSGFTYYCFQQQGIQIPRSSKQQIKAGKKVPYKRARKGDLIVFTGTDVQKREPGHVGIVVSNNAEGLTFIHSSSSKKNNGIVYTTIPVQKESFYKERFLQVRRVL